MYFLSVGKAHDPRVLDLVDFGNDRLDPPFLASQHSGPVISQPCWVQSQA